MNVNAGEEFTYLGSKVSTDDNIIRVVRTRIAKAAVAFNSLNIIWKSQNISRKRKLSLSGSISSWSLGIGKLVLCKKSRKIR